MTMKQRMLAMLRGERMDRVPFVQYDGTGGPNEEIWNAVGRQNMGLLRWSSACRVEHPNCRVESQQVTRDGRSELCSTLVTPAGRLTEIRRFVPGIPGVTTPVEHYVKTPDDYRILAAYMRDAKVVEDVRSIENAWKDFGDCGLPHVAICRSPFQQMWIQWASIADFSMHLVDAPAAVEECMDLMGHVLLKSAEATFAAADRVQIPYVVVPDNITAPLIGEKRFRKYCLPYYRTVAELLAGKDIPLAVHMDGDLEGLWQAIGQSGVRIIDSLSPPPDNDTSAAAAASMWPQMRLMVNFPSSVHLADAETVYRTATEILRQAGHTGRLWIQVSENTPPGSWKVSYPAIVRAIEDFGAP
jgi:uroporphyrinogen-III decarboxylase